MGKLVWMATGGVDDLTSASTWFTETQTSTGIQNVKLKYTILNCNLAKYESETVYIVCKVCPIKLAELPVEVVARTARDYSPGAH